MPDSLVIHQGAGAGDAHPVDGELILGRERGTADLVLDDPGVSRRHARVLPDHGGVLLEDLGSSNGTYVNGERISGPVELASGDEVQLGATVLGLEGGTPTTALMSSPGPRRSQRGPVPRRLAPGPRAQTNIPALSAIFLGPLSILLTFLSAGGFFLAFACGIAAIVLGRIGIRNADRRQAGHGALARIGRFTGFLGVTIAAIALLVFLAVSAVQ